MTLDKQEKTDSNHEVLKSSLKLSLPLLGFVLFALLSFYYSRTQASLQIKRTGETALLDLQRQYLGSDIDSVVTDLRFFASNPHVKSLLNEGHDGNSVDIQAIQQEFLEFSRAKKLYDQLRILDSRGQETVRINYNAGHPEIVAKELLQNKKGRYYFDDTLLLGKNEIFISPLDLNVENGQIEQPLKPMIRFGTPLIGEDDQKHGILLLNYFGSRLLDRFKTLGRTSSGTSYLLNRTGYYLQAENPDLVWGFMYPDQEVFKSTLKNDHPDAWQKINAAVKGQFETADGLYTFHSIYPLAVGASSSTGNGLAKGKSLAILKQGEYFWKLVSFIPTQTLYAENYALRKILALSMLLVSAILGWVTWKFSLAKYSKDQAEEEVKILQGVLPICMYCKEIRDDEGSWSQLEKYIAENSAADFSHGICDKCMTEKYGDDTAERVTKKARSVDKKTETNGREQGA